MSKPKDDPKAGTSSSLSGLLGDDAVEPGRSKVPAPEIDPEKHLKRIQDAFEVSTRIKDLVRRRRASPPSKATENEAKDQLVRGALSHSFPQFLPHSSRKFPSSLSLEVSSLTSPEDSSLNHSPGRYRLTSPV